MSIIKLAAWGLNKWTGVSSVNLGSYAVTWAGNGVVGTPAEVDARGAAGSPPHRQRKPIQLLLGLGFVSVQASLDDLHV